MSSCDDWTGQAAWSGALVLCLERCMQKVCPISAQEAPSWFICLRCTLNISASADHPSSLHCSGDHHGTTGQLLSSPHAHLPAPACLLLQPGSHPRALKTDLLWQLLYHSTSAPRSAARWGDKCMVFVQGHLAAYGARLLLLRISLCQAVAHALASRRTGASLLQVAQVMQGISQAWEQARAAEEQAAAEKEEVYKSKSSEQIEEVRCMSICCISVAMLSGSCMAAGGHLWLT